MNEIKPLESIVITGASSGIGKACALHFDGLGFKVFAGVRREKDALELKKISSGNLKPILLDVTSPSMISSALEQVSNNLRVGGLTGLVNNAGIPLGGSVEFLSLSDFRYEIEVNLIDESTMHNFLQVTEEQFEELIQMM